MSFHLGNFHYKKFSHYSSLLGGDVYDIRDFTILRRTPKTISLIEDDIPLSKNYRIKRDEKGEYIKIHDCIFFHRKIKVYAIDLKNLSEKEG